MQSQDQAIQKAIQLSKTAEGEQLIRLLQQTGGTDLEDAMKNAAAGDYSQAKQILSQLMKNQEVKKLLENFGK